ncbi:DoxX family protein [Ferrimicrobium sp.]|uniref:DoxX family protein n=1 Tax=Ferrimicrobium sp. TaxID=2926050 RepID=UPI0026105F25|nr:DoxX family protein [Ferrimicrobium sp.]
MTKFMHHQTTTPTKTADVTNIEEPRAARWLFASKAASWIWLIVRLWLGYEWINAGASKLWGAESAAFWRSGLGVKGFTLGAIAESKGPHAQVSYGWWVTILRHGVLPHYLLVARVDAIAELVIGIALVLGAFSAIAAFFGLALNFTYVFSGAVSTNPVFIILGIGIVLAWRNAGWLGLDRYLLPRMGTPWQHQRALPTQDPISRDPISRDSTN